MRQRKIKKMVQFERDIYVKKWYEWDGQPKLNNVSIYREVYGVWGPPFVAVKPF